MNPPDFGQAYDGRPRHRHEQAVENNDDIKTRLAHNSDSTQIASSSSEQFYPSAHYTQSHQQHNHHNYHHYQDIQDPDFQDMDPRVPLPSPPPALPLPSSYHNHNHSQPPLPKLPPFLPPPGSVPGSGSGFVSGIEAAAASAMTLANNIGFRPTASQPAKCSKLKIRIFFDSTIFQAGGNLFGRMEITASSSRSLKLGEIAVELAAYEEITSRELTATQSFLSSRLCFQGPDIPPSNAVSGPCDEYGFWTAKKGKTTFPFAFQLPLDCPSSLVFGQTASLRYVVTGLVQVFYHGRDETILKTKEAFVVEAWDGYNPEYKLPVKGSNSTKLFWGGGGSLVLDAILSEQLHSAGGNLTVEVKVTNDTSRKVQGIRLGVARRLEMVSDKEKAERNPGLKIDTTSVSEMIGTQEFKSSSYLFDTGEERTMTINMIVPSNARTIRGTALFEVTCFVVVSMLLGAFSGELSVEIPVKICHPASLTPAPKPKLEQNHLPHLYNLVDEGMDDNDAQSRRIGSSTSLAITSDDNEKIGRQGEWDDGPQLSPANSITSIKSLLKNPKDKLSKLADKIQRSTSPTSSGHLSHEHRHGSKHNDRPESRRVVKSPPLGPAMPIAYVPAVERVRYTPFQPPPTTKAKEFLKAAAQYQQEMAIGGAFAGMGGDNQEFDFDDKTMATAIHQWISRKESESMRPSSPPNKIQAPRATRPTPPVQIPVSPNRKRPTVDPIDTRSIGSFSSHQSPSSPQSHVSTSSPVAQGFSPANSRFIQHAHRQPAAPQTSAFGSAPEDCSTTPPLFARPLPLPSPPPTGSPHRPGARDGISAPQHPRPVSPVPIPIQSPESLALAREAYERVKRAGSPIQNPLANALTPTSSAPKSSGFLTQQHPQQPQQYAPLEVDLTIKVPVPQRSPAPGAISPSSPSELSRLLNENATTATVHHPKHGRDGHTIETTPPEPCSSPELRHVPMNRPLPVPGPKPRHLNQPGPAIGAPVPPRPRPEPAKRPPIIAPTSVSNISPASNVRSVQQNAFVLKATSSSSPSAVPTPVTRKPLPNPIKPTVVRPSPPATITAQQQQKPNSQGDASGNHGFVYPRATRKPVLGVKPPSVAAKPKALTTQTPSLEDEVNARQENQELKMLQTASMRAPQLITANALSEEHQITRGFQTRSDRTVEVRKDTAIIEEETGDGEAQNDDGRDPELTKRLAAPLPSTVSQMRGSGHLAAPQKHQDLSSVTARNEPSKETGIKERPRGEQPPHHRHHDTPRYENPNRRNDRRGGVQPIVSPPSRTTQERAVSPDRPVLTREQRQRQTNQQQQQQQQPRRQEQYQAESQPVLTTTTTQATAQATSYVSEASEDEVQTQSEIRAQAVAAAHSFRAMGAMVNTGGYAVDTGRLRQVMHEANSNQNNNSSGHLISALADGARNAVSGLGWKASTPPTSGQLAGPQRASNLLQQQQQQQPRKGSGSRQEESRPSREREQRPVVIPEQGHDLTMKDINFQTITPHNQSHHAEMPKVMEALNRAPIQGSREARDDVYTHGHNRPASPGSRVLPAQASRPIATTPSLSTSVTDVQTTAAVAVAVSTSSSHIVSSDSSSTVPDLSGLNLDKTLPKIQEDKRSRSKIIERPEPSSSVSTSSSSSSSVSTTEQSAPGRSKFFERSEKRLEEPSSSSSSRLNGGVVTKNLPHPRSTPAPVPPRTRGVIADLGLSGQGQGQGAKAVNPKFQEYIQKYNLAANTRG
ncbi:hypothetical protein MVEG_05401 [Podila verticillata NRRL 6337]|nr:hypothetical protein MVEG_05401 [Podila verticillata NRRL 6337]